MSYTIEESQRIFNLLGQVVWYTQHLELVMTQYNSLLTLQSETEFGGRISETDIRKIFTSHKKMTLEELLPETKEHGVIPEEMEARFDFFLAGRNWILHDSVCDKILSFKDDKSKKHFYGSIET